MPDQIEEQFILNAFGPGSEEVESVQFSDYPTATEAGKAWLRSGEAKPGSFFIIDKRTVLVTAEG